MNFFQFLESLIVENADEMSFIFKFFENFDFTNLLVFSDWLQEQNDPREELVRNAVQNKLHQNKETESIAKKLNINNIISARDGYDKTIMFSTKQGIFFFSLKDFKFHIFTEFKDGKMNSKEIAINQIPPKILQAMFWSVVGYGI